MSEMKTPIKTINGHALVDTEARAGVEANGNTIRQLTEEKADKLNYAAYGLPMLYLTGDTTGMTKENPVTLSFTYKELTGTCEVKWQGSSSLNWPKKNFTIKFDQEFEAKTGWGAQKKYCFKANFIDHSHARNLISCKLWGEIVRSRSEVPEELATLPNAGAVDGFPCIIMLNGEFHGLYTWNIPKDGWMFESEYGTPKAILCANDHCAATQFKALATLEGDFDLEYVEDENNADWVLTSLNNAIQKVIDSDGGDLFTVVDKYIDIQSAIDYYIHTVYEAAADATDKNYILVTFDGVKWYFSNYDRDTTYGIDWDGKTFYPPFEGTTFETYAFTHRLMSLLYFGDQKVKLMSRALYLANNELSESNVLNAYTNFGAGIPSNLLDADAEKWPTIPGTSVSSTWQIVEWYRLRHEMLSTEIQSYVDSVNLFDIGKMGVDYEGASSGKPSDITVDTHRNRLIHVDASGSAACYLRSEAYSGAGTYNFSATFKPQANGNVKPMLLCRFYDADGNIMTNNAPAGWTYNSFFKAYFVQASDKNFVVPESVKEWKVGFVFSYTDDSGFGKNVIISNPIVVKIN